MIRRALVVKELIITTLKKTLSGGSDEFLLYLGALGMLSDYTYLVFILVTRQIFLELSEQRYI